MTCDTQQQVADRIESGGPRAQSAKIPPRARPRLPVTQKASASLMALPQRTSGPVPRWADLDEAAEYLGVSPLTVRRRIADGTIPGHRLGRRVLRVDLNEVDAAMEPVPASKS